MYIHVGFVLKVRHGAYTVGAVPLCDQFDCQTMQSMVLDCPRWGNWLGLNLSLDR